MEFRTFLQESQKGKSKKNAEQINEIVTQLQYPTGFMYLDYICGSYVIPEDDDGNKLCMYHNIGIRGGSVNMIIGKSQCGKTSIAVSMAAGILEPWFTTEAMKRYLNPKYNPKIDWSPKALIQYLDSEKTSDAGYVKKIVRLKNKILRRSLSIEHISTNQDLMNSVKQHIEYKLKTMQKVVYPMKDIYGNYIIDYPPTVCIIDSITQLVIEKMDGFDEEAMKVQEQNTAGALRARIISQLYTQLVNAAKRYNIIFFCINHINKAPNMSFLPQPKQYHGLKQDETISGGERSLYLATNILRLDRAKTIGGQKASSLDFGEGVIGFIVNASFIKNKSNSMGETCFLVYTNRRGYDPLLSTLYTAKERGELMKIGNFFALDRFPDIKFTMKNAYEVFSDHPEMITAAYDQFRDVCSKLLDNQPGKTTNNNNKKSLGTNEEEVYNFDFLTNNLV